MVGDTPSGPRRDRKPALTQAQQKSLVEAIEGLRTRHNAGKTTEWLDDNRGGDVDTIKELMTSTSDAVDFITTLCVHGSMQIELALFLGIGPMKKATLEDVLKIQEISGLQALNLHPKSLEDLVRGLSRELVRQIDGVDYTTPVKPTQQASPPKFSTAADILAYQARKPEPRPVQSGPVSRVWSRATHGSKTMIDLLNLLPESLGKSANPAPSGGKRVNKDAEGDGKTGKRVNKDDAKPTKRVNKDAEGDDTGTAKTGSKLPSKAKLIAHLQGLNGDTDAAIRDRLVKGLKGAATVQSTLSLMDEAGLPRP